MPRTAAEEKFIHEFTRQCLVGWADLQIRTGLVHLAPLAQEPYLSHAIEKGWLSKDGTRVLAAGFTAAAGQLKR
jgi:hypothetical protein